MITERYNLMRKIAYSAISDAAERLATLSRKLESSRNWNSLTEDEKQAISDSEEGLEHHNVVTGALHSVNKLLEVEDELRKIIGTFESRYEW